MKSRIVEIVDNGSLKFFYFFYLFLFFYFFIIILRKHGYKVA